MINLSFLSKLTSPLATLSSLAKSRAASVAAIVLVSCGILLRAWQGDAFAVVGYVLDGLALTSISLVLFYLLRVNRAILDYTATVNRIAEGDFEARILYISEWGSIGELGYALNRLVDLTDAFVREAIHSAQAVTHGHYFRVLIERGLPGIYRQSARAINESTRAIEAKVKDFHAASDTFETKIEGVISKVSTEAGQLQKASEAMSTVAYITSQRSEEATSASTQSSESVQAVASAAEELTASIHELRTRIGESHNAATEAAAEASKTDTLVQGLSDAAKRVSDVVQLINTIASQTNLLALNATIEAARAGESGKGFAVVATEVKALATQTAKATDEISLQINSMQTVTDQAVEAIRAIGAKILRMNDIAGDIEHSIEQQKFATEEIARNIHQAASSTNTVTSNVGDVTSAALETKAASEQVLSTANNLAHEFTSLRKESHDFLDAVRNI